MTYVDGFVIPIPKKSLPGYRRVASVAARVWREHGCLDYKECVADDLAPKIPGVRLPPPFPKMCRLKRSETVVFSYIVFRDRKHRDRVNAKVMKDPRILGSMDKMPPMDMKRFAYGGFRVIVDGAPGRRRRAA